MNRAPQPCISSKHRDECPAEHIGAGRELMMDEKIGGAPRNSDGSAPHTRNYSPEAVRRRIALRLRVLRLIGGFYAINAALAFLCFVVGLTPASASMFAAGAGLLHFTLFYGLFRSGAGERGNDSFLAVPQNLMAFATVFAIIEFWPQLCVYMLTLMPLIFCFGALAFRRRTALMMWLLISATSGFMMWRHHSELVLPTATPGQLTLSMVFYAAMLLCYLSVGLLGSELRLQLYARNRALAEATARIEQMASHDELTGALSRRAITTQLDIEVRRAELRGNTLCVALLDLDDFKSINDRYGHAAGDDVLREFSARVLSVTRSVDVFGRYGGEEFLLVLVDAPLATVQLRLERIREVVANNDWSGIASELRVTVSAGIAAFTPGETVADFIKRADQALYQAKKNGRNCVVTAS